MRSLAFAGRNRKELLREPLTLLFCVGFPLLLLFAFSLMQKSLPYKLYEIEILTPGIAVFSFSFISLFSGMLIAKDRGSSFLTRLFASPLTAQDFIIGYTLPLIPIAGLQSICCFAAAIILGLTPSVNILPAIAVLVIISLLYIVIGLFLGTVFSDKQIGGVFALFVNISAWLSGTWFDLKLFGETLEKIGYALPFAHAVDATRAALAGNYASVLIHLVWCVLDTIIIFAFAVTLFKRKMTG